MTKYTVIEPFKDSRGRHRVGDVLEDVEHASDLVNAGMIRSEQERKPQKPENKTLPETSSLCEPEATPTSEEENETLPEVSSSRKPQNKTPPKQTLSKNTGGKNK